MPSEMADEMVAMGQMLQDDAGSEGDGARQMLKQMYGQAEVVSSEHVGDEFHFRLRVPMPEMPEMPQVPGTGTSGNSRDAGDGETC